MCVYIGTCVCVCRVSRVGSKVGLFGASGSTKRSAQWDERLDRIEKRKKCTADCRGGGRIIKESEDESRSHLPFKMIYLTATRQRNLCKSGPSQGRPNWPECFQKWHQAGLSQSAAL